MGRYASIRKMDISNGAGVGVAYFCQGCPPPHCQGCFNPETWNFDGGKEFTDETINTIINLANKEYISRLSILGGECLCEENINDSTKLATKFKEIYPDKKIWLWTRYLFEDIKYKDILNYIDYLVDGKYIAELRDYKLKYRGSSNQQIWEKVNGVWVNVTEKLN